MGPHTPNGMVRPCRAPAKSMATEKSGARGAARVCAKAARVYARGRRSRPPRRCRPRAWATMKLRLSTSHLSGPAAFLRAFGIVSESAEGALFQAAAKRGPYASPPRTRQETPDVMDFLSIEFPGPPIPNCGVAKLVRLIDHGFSGNGVPFTFNSHPAISSSICGPPIAPEHNR
jgi:hypothetical protein